LGRPACAIKPIETGWDEATSDARLLAAASGRSIEETVHLRFAAPRSPRAAAAAEGRTIDFDALVAWCRVQPGSPLFLEGAGGWAVPIDHRRMADLALATADTILVVARAGLGTINHAVLTIEAARQARPVEAVILSCRPEDDVDFARENAEAIAELTGAFAALFPQDLRILLDRL
jgi:dethiobiotin synthetase